MKPFLILIVAVIALIAGLLTLKHFAFHAVTGSISLTAIHENLKGEFQIVHKPQAENILAEFNGLLVSSEDLLQKRPQLKEMMSRLEKSMGNPIGKENDFLSQHSIENHAEIKTYIDLYQSLVLDSEENITNRILHNLAKSKGLGTQEFIDNEVLKDFPSESALESEFKQEFATKYYSNYPIDELPDPAIFQSFREKKVKAWKKKFVVKSHPGKNLEINLPPPTFTSKTSHSNIYIAPKSKILTVGIYFNPMNDQNIDELNAFIGLFTKNEGYLKYVRLDFFPFSRDQKDNTLRFMNALSCATQTNPSAPIDAISKLSSSNLESYNSHYQELVGEFVQNKNRLAKCLGQGFFENESTAIYQEISRFIIPNQMTYALDGSITFDMKMAIDAIDSQVSKIQNSFFLRITSWLPLL